MSTDFEQPAEHSVEPPAVPARHKWSHWVSGIVGKHFGTVLDGITSGELAVVWPDGRTTYHGERSNQVDDNVQVKLLNYRALTMLMRSGEVGFAESYLRGDWEVDDLVNLFLLIMRNEQAIAHGLTGGPLARLGNTLKHWLNRNSRRGSQRNIAYHYDLGNAFYETWLDESMSYSSAIFASEQQTLAEAQQGKLDRVVQLLDARKGANVLEIGCGWGALGRHLADRGGLHVDGISLSREQLAWAAEHNSLTAGQQQNGSTNFRYIDYREVEGRYDHIVSIEMFEAVGEQYWSTYFQKLSELLERGGTAVLQVITILEERFEVYRSHPDFIQRYIFPGGMLPTKSHLSQLAAASGFDIVSTDWFGMSYARTLAEWRDRFNAVSDQVSQQGFDERFSRMWQYYLSYCEAGFRFGSTDVGMLVLAKRQD